MAVSLKKLIRELEAHPNFKGGWCFEEDETVVALEALKLQRALGKMGALYDSESHDFVPYLQPAGDTREWVAGWEPHYASYNPSPTPLGAIEGLLKAAKEGR